MVNVDGRALMVEGTAVISSRDSSRRRTIVDPPPTPLTIPAPIRFRRDSFFGSTHVSLLLVGYRSILATARQASQRRCAFQVTMIAGFD